MTNPDTPRYIEIRDGDHTVAAAEVAVSQQAGGTARASLRVAAGHVAPGRRADLVDAVMDLPEVQASARLEAAVPRGDGESLGRLRERTEDTVTRPAGSTTLVDADIPAPGQPGASRHPGGQTPELLDERGGAGSAANERAEPKRRPAVLFFGEQVGGGEAP
ncbi:MAG TPA: hypothetical protein VEF71_04450 [Streptosporangiaceae bacterium]|nr:hypothetical protein [Streptosporangiaceae bacterium]